MSEQRKRRISSRVSDDYEDIDEAEESKNVYQGKLSDFSDDGVI